MSDQKTGILEIPLSGLGLTASGHSLGPTFFLKPPISSSLSKATAKRNTPDGRRTPEQKTVKMPRLADQEPTKNFPPLLSSFVKEASNVLAPVFPPLLKQDSTYTPLHIRVEVQRNNTMPPQTQPFNSHISLTRSADMDGNVSYTFIFSALESLDAFKQQALQTAIRAEAVFAHRCGFTESEGSIIKFHLEDATIARNLLTELSDIFKFNAETSLLPELHCRKLAV